MPIQLNFGKWPGANQRHLAPGYVPELREFIHGVAAAEAREPVGDAGIGVVLVLGPLVVVDVLNPTRTFHSRR
jgi:hypothetical protein